MSDSDRLPNLIINYCRGENVMVSPGVMLSDIRWLIGEVQRLRIDEERDNQVILTMAEMIDKLTGYK